MIIESIKSATYYPLYKYPMQSMKHFDKVASALIKYWERERIEDAQIVFTGSSGVTAACLLNVALIKNDISPMSVCRITKEGEESHSGHTGTDDLQQGELVIIDDFISTGATMRRIYDALHASMNANLRVSCIIAKDILDFPHIYKEFFPNVELLIQ